MPTSISQPRAFGATSAGGQALDVAMPRSNAAKTAAKNATVTNGPAMNSASMTPIADGLDAPGKRDGRLVMLYNGECNVCSTIADWVSTQDDPKGGGKQLIDERPIGHDPAALTALAPSLDIWDAYEHVHVVMPDGTMKVDGEAVSEVFRRLPETRWAAPLLDVSIFGWKPGQQLVNGAFWVLASLRPALGCKACGTPVPWWGKPVEWAYKAFKKLSGADEPKPATSAAVG